MRSPPADVGDRGGGFRGTARPLVGLGGQGQAPRIGAFELTSSGRTASAAA